VHALAGAGGADVFRRIIAGDAVAPHVLDLEVVSGLRRSQRLQRASDAQVREAIADFATFRIERYSHELFLARVWELRQNVSTFDAAYVALAEFLDLPLVTRDRALASSTGHAARIEYID